MYTNEVHSELATINNGPYKWWHRRWVKITGISVIILIVFAVTLGLVLNFVVFAPKKAETNTPVATSSSSPATTISTPSSLSTTTPLVTSTTTQHAEWSVTGNMANARYYHTASVLSNGKVLVTGGAENTTSFLNSAELYDPSTGTWTTTGNMTIAPYLHTASVLPNGNILVAGGSSYNTLNSAELYDPITGIWTTTSNMTSARYRHTASVLPNGNILVAGGSSYNTLNSAELYDPSTGTWTTTGNMTDARYRHTASVLSNGKVLVTGGLSNGYILNNAELYDSSTGTWTTTGNMANARRDHTACVLSNGKVLVTGGESNGYIYLKSTELYDPSTGTWTTTGNMSNARAYHTASVLSNGKVLVAGGFNTGFGYLYQAELNIRAAGMCNGGRNTYATYCNTRKLNSMEDAMSCINKLPSVTGLTWGCVNAQFGKCKCTADTSYQNDWAHTFSEAKNNLFEGCSNSIEAEQYEGNIGLCECLLRIEKEWSSGFQGTLLIPVIGTHNPWELEIRFNKSANIQTSYGNLTNKINNQIFVYRQSSWNDYPKINTTFYFEFVADGNVKPSNIILVLFDRQPVNISLIIVPPLSIFPSKPINISTNNGTYDYGAVLSASILFYESQRSGRLPSNKRISWRDDSMLKDCGENGEDLTGGYFIDGSSLEKISSRTAQFTSVLAWGVIDYEDAYVKAGQLEYVRDAIRWSTTYPAIG
ncbi:unnamed protein product [Adineta steineri]|uniref:cellulase n=1 Tax=Adineta steineri TaxID=433720 RepID=A0A814YXX3_9BILA|nr:unnamed protein product [Adineta steineri]